MERRTEAFLAALAAGEEGERAMIEAMRGFEADLEWLGVVPEPVRELARRVAEAGGAAKISGAGSVGGPGAGALLVYLPAGAVPPPALSDLDEVPCRLGGEGLRCEVPA